MSQATSFYPALSADGRGARVVSHAGAVLLTRTAATVGLDDALVAALAPWKAPRAVHHPGKVVADLAVSIAIGGDALSDIAVLRAEPEVFGPVASDPTVSRLVDSLAADAEGPRGALAAIDVARASARATAWRLAGVDAPDHHADARRPLVVDIDASLVASHSEKELATPSFKRGFGFHPICAFVDHGAGGTGEPLALHLRPGSAGSNTVTDHMAVAKAALAQLPGYGSDHGGRRPGRNVLIRADAGGGTHGFIEWLTARRLSYSIGFTLPGTLADVQERLARIPEQAWYPAVDGNAVDGKPAPLREGAWVAEATGVFDLIGWPKGMRLMVRKERPHPGAQLRITDIDGLRVTSFVTNTVSTPAMGRAGQVAHLELRHRRRARAEDRIRCTKASGMTNLPLHDFDQNRVWMALVALAGDLVAWTQMLALAGHAARGWEPKRLRHRLFSIAGRVASHSRRRMLHLAATAPWTPVLLAGLERLGELARAGPVAAPG